MTTSVFRERIATALRDGTAIPRVAKLALGEGYAAPTPADTFAGMVNPVVVSVVAVVYSAEFSELFIAGVLPAGESIGLEIREVGLLDEDNVLLARLVRSEAITKTGDLELAVSFRLELR